MTEETREKARKKSAGRLLLEWVVLLLCAFLLALFVTRVLLVNAQVTSQSMENTIMTGDRILGSRCAYWFGEPQRGDIVIFRYPDDTTQLYIKRVIGLPGDTVVIRAGLVYINGADKPLAEPYLHDLPEGDFGPFVVPADSYFMMGDNRNDSFDSRYWNTTYVPRENILGRAWVRLYPGPQRIT